MATTDDESHQIMDYSAHYENRFYQDPEMYYPAAAPASSVELCETFDLIVCGVLISVICMVGLFGNCMSACVLFKQHLQTCTVTILQGLAVSDFILLLTTLPVYGLPVLAHYIWDNDTLSILHAVIDFSRAYIWPLSMVAHTCTVWLTVMVSVVRYFSVCRTFDRRSTSFFQQRGKVILCLVFTLSFLFSLPRYFEHQVIGIVLPAAAPNGGKEQGSSGVSNRDVFFDEPEMDFVEQEMDFVNQESGVVDAGSFSLEQDAAFVDDEITESIDYRTMMDTNATLDYQYFTLGDVQLYQIVYSNVLYFFVMYIIPLIVLIFMNTRLLKTERRLKKVRVALLGKQRRLRHKNDDDQITRIIITVVSVFIACQTPAMVNQILWALEPPTCGSSHFYYTRLSDLLVIINSSSNFIIYSLLGRSFRKVFIGFFCNKKKNGGGGGGGGSHYYEELALLELKGDSPNSQQQRRYLAAARPCTEFVTSSPVNTTHILQQRSSTQGSEKSNTAAIFNEHMHHMKMNSDETKRISKLLLLKRSISCGTLVIDSRNNSKMLLANCGLVKRRNSCPDELSNELPQMDSLSTRHRGECGAMFSSLKENTNHLQQDKVTSNFKTQPRSEPIKRKAIVSTLSRFQDLVRTVSLRRKKLLLLRSLSGSFDESLNRDCDGFEGGLVNNLNSHSGHSLHRPSKYQELHLPIDKARPFINSATRNTLQYMRSVSEPDFDSSNTECSSYEESVDTNRAPGIDDLFHTRPPSKYSSNPMSKDKSRTFVPPATRQELKFKRSMSTGPHFDSIKSELSSLEGKNFETNKASRLDAFFRSGKKDSLELSRFMSNYKKGPINPSPSRKNLKYKRSMSGPQFDSTNTEFSSLEESFDTDRSPEMQELFQSPLGSEGFSSHMPIDKSKAFVLPQNRTNLKYKRSMSGPQFDSTNTEYSSFHGSFDTSKTSRLGKLFQSRKTDVQDLSGLKSNVKSGASVCKPTQPNNLKYERSLSGPHFDSTNTENSLFEGTFDNNKISSRYELLRNTENSSFEGHFDNNQTSSGDELVKNPLNSKETPSCLPLGNLENSRAFAARPTTRYKVKFQRSLTEGGYYSTCNENNSMEEHSPCALSHPTSSLDLRNASCFQEDCTSVANTKTKAIDRSPVHNKATRCKQLKDYNYHHSKRSGYSPFRGFASLPNSAPRSLCSSFDGQSDNYPPHSRQFTIPKKSKSCTTSRQPSIIEDEPMDHVSQQGFEEDNVPCRSEPMATYKKRASFPILDSLLFSQSDGFMPHRYKRASLPEVEGSMGDLAKSDFLRNKTGGDVRPASEFHDNQVRQKRRLSFKREMNCFKGFHSDNDTIDMQTPENNTTIRTYVPAKMDVEYEPKLHNQKLKRRMTTPSLDAAQNQHSNAPSSKEKRSKSTTVHKKLFLEDPIIARIEALQRDIAQYTDLATALGDQTKLEKMEKKRNEGIDNGEQNELSSGFEKSENSWSGTKATRKRRAFSRHKSKGERIYFSQIENSSGNEVIE